MIIEALTKRRSEIAVEIRTLNEGLRHLDATIKLFKPEYKSERASRGHHSRAILDVLREAHRPMTTREIAQAAGIDMKRASITLNQQKRRGAVKSSREAGQSMVWQKT